MKEEDACMGGGSSRRVWVKEGEMAMVGVRAGIRLK